MATLKEKILTEFLEEGSLSGGSLEKKLGVSRTAIWKAVSSLQKDGFKIASKDRSGYQFLSCGDVINKLCIQKHLKSSFIILDILDKVDSTNLELKRRSEVKQNSVLVSRMQTSGMGRKGRPFYSPSGNLYMSVFLRPKLVLSFLQLLTHSAAVSVVAALKEVCDIKADIKWVNDVYIDRKKVCGISTDASISAELLKADYVILGIGINVASVGLEVESIATKAYQHTEKRALINALIASVLNNLEKNIALLENGKAKEILSEYKKHLFILGNTVKVIDNESEYNATVLDLTENGELVVKKKGGEIVSLIAGEISLSTP